MIEIKRLRARPWVAFVCVALFCFLPGCAKKNAGEEAGTPVQSGASGQPSSTAGQAGASSQTGTAESTQQHEISLVALSAGAYIVKRPSEWMDSESAYALLDENPRSKWATARGTTSPQTIVIALPEKTLLKTIAFDNQSTDSQFTGCGAKDISVEMSDASENDGFQKIAEVSLKEGTDDQRFPVSAEVPGRWVRLTVKNNHSSDPDNTIELNEFRAYGTQLTHTPMPDLSGTYDFDFTGGFHVKQEGTFLTGCYESREGLIKGGVEGHIGKFTWFEKSGYEIKEMGSAIMVLPPDGKQAIGVWWEGMNTDNSERILIGPKKSSDIGSCAHWAGGLEQQLIKDLEQFGRARVYGINFDTDSDQLKAESKPTLDKIASILKAKPDWKITIEGHTDSTSTPQHNQDLSEKRAATVKSYLQSAGINPSRMNTAGYGATKPVASNDTEIGRAQNRRVELMKQ
ncbi:MAG TPA: OmpA family protein [Terriglobales bacterium]|nr:OmpA family protein [Terriglobales bacterium]